MEEFEAENYVRKEEVKIPEELIRNPYDFVCNWAEKLYPNIGSYVFQYASLLPCSLIINDFNYFSEKKRSNLNIFLLTEAGGAKSSLCKLFAKLTFYPIEGRSYTAAELEDEVFEKEIFSLIIEDYTTMASDERINKIMEGILGDEKIIDRHTKRKKIRKQIEAVGFLCGVPNDVTDRLTRGKMSRALIIVKIYGDKEHSDIGKYIAENIGVSNNECDGDEYPQIKEYYELLQKIQGGEEKFPFIDDFEISRKIREDIVEKWDDITQRIRGSGIKFNFQRELEDGFRILVAHSFLNYFNRNKNGNTLIVNEEDCKVAKRLMARSLITKYNLYRSEKLAGGIRSSSKFHEIMGNEKVSKEIKQLIPVYLQKKFKK